MNSVHYHLLRYLPITKNDDESLSAGVIERNLVTDKTRVRLSYRLSRIKMLDPAHRDIAEVQRDAIEIKRYLEQGEACAERLLDIPNKWGPNWLTRFLGSYRADLRASIFDDFIDQYLKSDQSLKRKRKLSEREHILAQSIDKFHEFNVLPFFTRNASMSAFTYASNPTMMDFVLAIGNNRKMLHAVAVTSDPNSAFALAERYPRFRDGALEKYGWTSELTILLSDETDVSSGLIQEAFDAFDRQGIKKAFVSDLDQVAQGIRDSVRA